MKKQFREGHLKVGVVHWLVFIIIMTILIVIYVPCAEKIKLDKVEEVSLVSDFSIITSVEGVEETKGNLYVSGWAMRLKASNEDIVMLLEEVETGEQIACSTKMEERKKVNELFSREDQSLCGFVAKIQKKDLKEDSCYRILLYLKGEMYESTTVVKRKVFTEMYLYNNELYRYNPHDFYLPAFVEEEVLEFIEKGEVYFFDSGKQVWIYKYGDELCWVVKTDLFGNAEDRVEIPMFTFYTQIDNSNTDNPSLTKKYKGYYLDESDYQNKEEEEYFVHIMPLDMSQTIYSINTGVYNNAGTNPGWVWNKMVRFNPTVIEE